MMKMLKFILLVLILLSTFPLQAQDTYKIGNTEYYSDKTYSSTGLPIVKRSTSNKKQFLNSLGYDKTPYGYEVDHKIPLSEGGTDDPSNMQLLTIESHAIKTAHERSSNSIVKYQFKPIDVSKSLDKIRIDNTTNSDRIIYTGPKGGQYYINSNGNKTYIKSKSNNTVNDYSAPTYNSNTKIIHTGPRGGKYYINKNGNKTYVKKK